MYRFIVCCVQNKKKISPQKFDNNKPSIHPYVIVIIGNEVKLNLQIELSYLSLLRLMFVLTHYTLVSVGVVHSLQCNNMILVEFSCIP